VMRCWPPEQTKQTEQLIRNTVALDAKAQRGAALYRLRVCGVPWSSGARQRYAPDCLAWRASVVPI
jgi:hypothetical protein